MDHWRMDFKSIQICSRHSFRPTSPWVGWSRPAALARNEDDPKALIGQLEEVVQTSLQPESVSIWLKVTGRERGK